MSEKDGTIPGHLKNINVLIAEDEEYNYLFLNEVLRKYNINQVRAYNGKMAIDICASNPQIHLVLMDLRMPVIDGLEATRQIKKLRPKLPVIAQTAHAMDSDREMVMAEGFDNYISKPIKAKELYDIILEYAPKSCPVVKREV